MGNRHLAVGDGIAAAGFRNLSPRQLIPIRVTVAQGAETFDKVLASAPRPPSCVGKKAKESRTTDIHHALNSGTKRPDNLAFLACVSRPVHPRTKGCVWEASLSNSSFAGVNAVIWCLGSNRAVRCCADGQAPGISASPSDAPHLGRSACGLAQGPIPARASCSATRRPSCAPRAHRATVPVLPRTKRPADCGCQSRA